MKVLIIGAAGYVGHYLAWKMQDSYELRLADLTPPNPAIIPWVYTARDIPRREEFTPKLAASLPFFPGDILDVDYCRRITEGMDAVIHLSASVNHEDTVGCFKTNALGTFNVLQACAENDVKRVLVASSINASGWFHCRITDRPRNWPYLPVDEAYPTDHEDAYSLSKYVNELNCAAWTNRTGMTTAAFRFSGVFPPERTELTKDRVEPTKEWPETLATYVDLRDVVQGLLKALECPTLPPSGVYNLIAADTTLPEPTMEIIERFRPELLKVLRAPIEGFGSMLSSQRAAEAFGYKPEFSWRNY